MKGPLSLPFHIDPTYDPVHIFAKCFPLPPLLLHFPTIRKFKNNLHKCINV
jgi:hypothetical protein